MLPSVREVLTKSKQEDKNWFRTYKGLQFQPKCYEDVIKQSDILIIDDDDNSDDWYIAFEEISSRTEPIQKQNKQISTAEPEILVLYYSDSDNRMMFDNNIPYDQDSFDIIIDQNELSLFSSDDVSLESVISTGRCGGNQYILMEEQNLKSQM